MKTNIQIKSLISELDRNSIYHTMYIGTTAFSNFINENTELTKSKSFKEIQTRFLNFILKRQFEHEHLPKNFPFKTDFKRTNGFGSHALFLTNNFTKITIKKDGHSSYLNKSPRYLLEEAKPNSQYSHQLKFFIDIDDPIEIKEDSRIFVILEFDFKNSEIVHLEFVIPDEKLKTSLDKFNALQEYKLFISSKLNDSETNESIEESIVELKKFAATASNN